jgi:hypothetical protein
VLIITNAPDNCCRIESSSPDNMDEQTAVQAISYLVAYATLTPLGDSPDEQPDTAYAGKLPDGRWYCVIPNATKDSWVALARRALVDASARQGRSPPNKNRLAALRASRLAKLLELDAPKIVIEKEWAMLCEAAEKLLSK